MSDLLEAMAELGPRPAGTAAAKYASQLVADALVAAGAVVAAQPLAYEGWEYGEPPKVAMLAPEYREVPAAPMPFAPASARVVEGATTVSDEPIVLAGVPFSFSMSVAGASQVARLLVAETDVPFPLPAFDGQSLPSAVVGSGDGELIRAFVRRGIPVSLSVETFGTAVTAADVNVIGVLDGDETRTIAVTSHYDSAWRSPGASDNAAGVASMVELARRVRGYNLENEIRVHLFWRRRARFGRLSHIRGIGGCRRALPHYLAVVNLDPALGSNQLLRCEVGPGWLRDEAATVAAELSLPFLGADPGGAVDSTPSGSMASPFAARNFFHRRLGFIFPTTFHRT